MVGIVASPPVIILRFISSEVLILPKASIVHLNSFERRKDTKLLNQTLSLSLLLYLPTYLPTTNNMI